MMRIAVPLAMLAMGGCQAVPPPQAPQTPPAAAATPAQPPARPIPIPGPPLGPAEFGGQLEQGGWIRGTAPMGTVAASSDGKPLAIDPQNRGFFVGIDRDAPPEMVLRFTARDGQARTHRIAIARRAWIVENIDAARLPGGATEAFMAIRRPELARIGAARANDHDVGGWRQTFVWPVKGRISGRFGSQRVYRGEPGAYHSGLDIAPGAGAAYVAPADGVVVLAATRPFSLEGNLLIVDHGSGLNSAFLHSQRLAVREGDRVSQGQLLGYVGATGRATGPHLHWSLEWQGARLDPLLFLPPQ